MLGASQTRDELTEDAGRLQGHLPGPLPSSGLGVLSAFFLFHSNVSAIAAEKPMVASCAWSSPDMHTGYQPPNENEPLAECRSGRRFLRRVCGVLLHSFPINTGNSLLWWPVVCL